MTKAIVPILTAPTEEHAPTTAMSKRIDVCVQTATIREPTALNDVLIRVAAKLWYVMYLTFRPNKTEAIPNMPNLLIRTSTKTLFDSRPQMQYSRLYTALI